MKIDNRMYLLLVLIPIHLGVISMFWLTNFTLMHLLFLIVGWILLGGLGVNVGLHRWASHRSVKLNKYAKPIIIYFSILACQGHPYWWAAVHRGLHHRFPDTEKDLHSPVNGKWNSFIGWILVHNPSKVRYRYITTLTTEFFLKHTYRHYHKIIWITWVIVGLLNIHLLLWAFILPAVIALHSEGLVNLLCHSKIGYRNFNTNDKSRNVPLLGYFAWGNGWHNNHHARPGSFDFGKSTSENKKEFDPCTLFLPLIEKRK